jgi:hypothetical protein
MMLFLLGIVFSRRVVLIPPLEVCLPFLDQDFHALQVPFVCSGKERGPIMREIRGVDIGAL